MCPLNFSFFFAALKMHTRDADMFSRVKYNSLNYTNLFKKFKLIQLGKIAMFQLLMEQRKANYAIRYIV